MKKIVTVGEIVVEIMAAEINQSLRTTGSFLGPYPSGAPAIFIDQVSQLGFPCGIISCVGKDDFGFLNMERLEKDGVDVTAVKISDNSTTGSAFVNYNPDGSRDFIFNIKNSACSEISSTPESDKLVYESSHLHIMGSSLFTPKIINVVKKSIEVIKDNGGTVSFDPNMRKEMLSLPETQDTIKFILKNTDIFLPSGSEIFLLDEGGSEYAAVEKLLAFGIKEIVLKRGGDGCSYFSTEQQHSVSAYATHEIDPTGAGDCFGATFVTCRLLGMPPEEALRYANASGAIAVSRRGPMEGVSTFETLDVFLARH